MASARQPQSPLVCLPDLASPLAVGAQLTGSSGVYLSVRQGTAWWCILIDMHALSLQTNGYRSCFRQSVVYRIKWFAMTGSSADRQSADLYLVSHCVPYCKQLFTDVCCSEVRLAQKFGKLCLAASYSSPATTVAQSGLSLKAFHRRWWLPCFTAVCSSAGQRRCTARSSGSQSIWCMCLSLLKTAATRMTTRMMIHKVCIAFWRSVQHSAVSECIVNKMDCCEWLALYSRQSS